MNSLPLILPAALTQSSLPWPVSSSNNSTMANNKDNNRSKITNAGDLNSSQPSVHFGESADFTDTDTSQTTSSYKQRANKKQNLGKGINSSDSFMGEYLQHQLGQGVNSSALTQANLQQIQSQPQCQQIMSNRNKIMSLSPNLGAKQRNSAMIPPVIASTAEDKQKANRNRNREHARNTRLRKKAYLEKLKVTVDELCRERDSLLQERTSDANRVLETLATRTEVVLGFLALRQHPVKHLNHSLWNALISEHSFQCHLPITPYRSFPAAEVSMQCCRRTLHGIEALIADCASLHMMFDSLLALPVDMNANVSAGYQSENSKVSFQYSVITENATNPAKPNSLPNSRTPQVTPAQLSQVQTSNPSNLISGIVCNNNLMMARWQMKTTNLMKFGASSEVSKGGMVSRIDDNLIFSILRLHVLTFQIALLQI